MRAALLRSLFNNIRFIVFANIGTMILTVALRWEQENRPWLLAWGAGLSAVVFARWMLARGFRSAAVTPETARGWIRLFALATALNGLAWGATAHLIVMPDPRAYEMLAIGAIVGFTVIALISYTAHPLAFLAFAVPSLAPYAAELADGRSSLGLWALPLCLGWIAAAAFVAASLGRRQAREYARQFERDDLIGELAAARDEARRANEAKTRFLGHMSHELRTPLNAVIGFSEMILSGRIAPAGPKFEAYVQGIHDSGKHLLRLVSDILDLTRIEAGRFALEEETVDVARLLAGAAEIFRDEAAKDGIEIALAVAPDLPRLRADPTRLRQIVYNLLSNALKYAPAGDTVRLGAARAEDGLIVAVEDHGPGMSEQEIALAPVPFLQLERRDQRSYPSAKRGAYAGPGTGLGLPLVSKLMEAHGGRALITSAPGRGTTVQAIFPAARLVG